MIDAEGHDSVTNTYNGNGSLKNVQDAKGNTTSYEYNGFLGLKKTIYEDDTYEQPTYDEYRIFRGHGVDRGELPANRQSLLAARESRR